MKNKLIIAIIVLIIVSCLIYFYIERNQTETILATEEKSKNITNLESETEITHIDKSAYEDNKDIDIRNT